MACSDYLFIQHAAPASSQAIMLAVMSLFYAGALVRRMRGGAVPTAFATAPAAVPAAAA